MLRTHHLGSLEQAQIGENLVLCGWVARVRAVGEVNFVVLRDRYGVVQLNLSASVLAENKLSREDCLRVFGSLQLRPETDRTNEKNGGLEVVVDQIEILNSAEVPPFVVDGKEGVSEDLRLKYRYLDLRSRRMTSHLEIRHRVIRSMRAVLDSLDFFEVETPLLMKSTPEGARDFLVPSRVFPGEYYALPQSPQIYKQIVQVSGLDRYYQFARCFRDEDPRNDRQMVHTQMDLEMSFVEEEDIFFVIEAMLEKVFQEVLGKEIATPFQRMKYSEAIEKYGSDKPDLRFSLELINLAEYFRGTDHPGIRAAIEDGGRVAGMVVPGGAAFSRKELDSFSEYVKTYKAQGAFFMKCTEEGFVSGAAKLLPESLHARLKSDCGARDGDLILFIAGEEPATSYAMGYLRNQVARTLHAKTGNFIESNSHNLLWITDFPLFEYDNEINCWQAMHHMFTMPRKEDLKYFETGEFGKIHGRLYDLVLNGVELGSGSIRIHEVELQEKIFEIIGFSQADAQQRFGFFLESLRYGAPPHGGIALGVARLIMTLLELDNMRDVIAFPNASSCRYLLDDSPTMVSLAQLQELGIKTSEK